MYTEKDSKKLHEKKKREDFRGRQELKRVKQKQRKLQAVVAAWTKARREEVGGKYFIIETISV